MRILWVCNIVPPAVAEQLNTATTVKEGWITGTLERLSRENTDIELGICMPVNDIDGIYKRDNVKAGSLDIACYRFLEQTSSPWVYDATLEKAAEDIIRDFNPDMIHCFGTEYPHTYAFAKVWNRPERFLVGIQGVMKACADNYCNELEEKVVNGYTFRDAVKRDNIAIQRSKFYKRAEFEEKALKLTGHAAGRTQFDKAGVAGINRDTVYHHLSETLRPEFYEGSWELDRLQKHAVFVSQADYPLKGFHIMLKAMPKILAKYPDTRIYVAGNSITAYRTLKEKLKIGTYGRYLRQLMTSLGIEDKVTVLGRLSAFEMKQQYLNSSVLVCTSFIENSPNSVGEAMLLGTPVIATRTGGIPSMVTQDKEALLVAPGNEEELAAAVIKLFDNEELAKNLSEAGRIRARINHNADENYKALMEIYKEICQ